ncbi:hypothetical protein CFP56_025495 [Quercus suber]|uniref:Uncharacterized protein n=1 Tax=Quercus suber TaxID=58331 RepID=A0AAW0LWN4_QUESU
MKHSDLVATGSWFVNLGRSGSGARFIAVVERCRGGRLAIVVVVVAVEFCRFGCCGYVMARLSLATRNRIKKRKLVLVVMFWLDMLHITPAENIKLVEALVEYHHEKEDVDCTQIPTFGSNGEEQNV